MQRHVDPASRHSESSRQAAPASQEDRRTGDFAQLVEVSFPLDDVGEAFRHAIENRPIRS